MVFLENERIKTHNTYQSILSLPLAPLIKKGLQGKKNEDRLAFIESLDKSGIILEKSSFLDGFDPYKEQENISSLDFESLLTLLSAYHRSIKKDPEIFDAGLYNGNIKTIIEALKKDAKSLILKESEDDVREYTFIDKGLMSTPMTLEAFEIAYKCFKDAFDKGGMPYIYHPIRVALRVNGEEAIVAALLHDVLEDRPDLYSREKLLERGISEEIIDAVELLTHEHGVPYLAYVKEISKNPIARKVKWGDLMDNLNKNRNHNNHSPKSLYYFKSLSLLEKTMNEEDKDSLYFYYPEEDIFFKKTKHGNFALDEGRYIHCPYRIKEDVIELTFEPDDPCLYEDCLPYFKHGHIEI